MFNELLAAALHVLMHDWEYKVSPYYDLPGVIRVCTRCKKMQWKGREAKWAGIGGR